MRIAFLTEFFYPHVGGCERRFLEIGRRLAARDHEIHVFTLQYDRCLPKEEFVDGITVHRYAYSRGYISRGGFRSVGGVLKYSLASLARLSEQEYDVYYSSQWPMLHSVLVRPVAKPFVQEWCEVWRNSLKAIMLQRLLKNVSQSHVAVSEFTRLRLSSLLKLDPNKVVVIPNGVDSSRFRTGLSRKVWGRIVYVGRVVPHKHVELLLEAFCKVKRKVPEAELHIVGSGSSLALVQYRGAAVEDCYVYGFLPEEHMVELLKSAWILVLPSEREGSGIVALEAMAAGVPFVTADYPDNAVKELTKYDLGVAVPPRPNFIAAGILQLLNDVTLWKTMSWNAHEFAAKHEWDTVTDAMEGFLKGIQ